MSARASWLRTAALVCAGSFAVHHLRYLFAYGVDAGRALNQQGHSYLWLLEPLVGLALALLASQLVWRLVASSPRRRAKSAAHRSLILGSALLAVYVAQELAEGALAYGHAAGLAGVFGTGGWVAVPLAFAVGALAALVVRHVDALDAVPIVDGTPRCRVRVAALVIFAPAPARCPAAPLARHLAGRGPPTASR